MKSKFLSLILLAVAAIFGAGAGPTTQPTAPPLVITKSCTYAGTAENPLVFGQVSINAPANSTIALSYVHYDNLVGTNVANLSITDCVDSGKEPTYASVAWRFQTFVFEHNEVHGQGLLFRDFSGQAKSYSVCYNNFIDINGATGPTSRVKVSAIQAANLHIPDGKVLYNRITNHRGSSSTEDCLSMMQSGGTAGHPVLIQHNLVDGSFNWPVITTAQWAKGVHFSGSGIMAFDPGSVISTSVGGYTDVSFNTVLAVENQGIACAGGHDISIHDNRVVNDGTSTPFASWGLQLWNWNNETPATIFGTNNIVANNRSCVYVLGKRSDFSIYHTAVQNPPNVAGSDTEAQARADWEADVAAQGIVIGPRPPVSVKTVSQPLVMIGNASITKPATGTAPLNFAVTLTEPVASPVSVTYGTVAGTASSGAGDYVGITSSTLVIPSGKTTGNITVQVKGNMHENPTETFQVRITGVAGASIGSSAMATGTISGIAATQPSHE